MYREGFYLTQSVGNNTFSYDNRKNKKLYIPSLINGSIDDIKLGDQVVFEDYDFDDKLSSCYGLKNFYKIPWDGKDIYLFDNHNHAYYFWYLARAQGIIGDNNTLIHIDEHADTRDGGEYLLKPDSCDLKKVFQFTNFTLNVGNYIIPAQKEGIIADIIQVRNETNLKDYMDLRLDLAGDIVLNLDLDFFQPDLDFIDFNLKKKVVLDAAKKAKIITVATSPFFINQELAIEVFRGIFEGK
ncbi:hypothetical protein A9Q91_01760 [Candidatus Gracilibacteria bacterium 28_42_T64]|nr:hypothetical protein A9Q91_01760 [Candidatus Gracilibacteria bacterium 28_42_T64]